MPIYNKRFEIRKERGHHLETINNFFKENLKKNQTPIRYAIVDVKRNKLVVEASILEE